jgi:ApaG protein
MFALTPYQSTTHGITISVAPLYVPDQSDPENNVYVFIYGVNIVNHRVDTVQLLSRKWIIKDGEGNQRVVEGEGVIGKMPYLKPNETFDYSSFCPLKTPTGNMRGHYIFEDSKGEDFTVEVPLFFFRLQDRVGVEASELYKSSFH